MWIFTGFVRFLKDLDITPDESGMFHQFVTSMSKNMASQSSRLASLLAFQAAKRREFYVSHLPPNIQDHQKLLLQSSPCLEAETLFGIEEVKNLSSESQQQASRDSSQALVDFVQSAGSSSGTKRKRSPSRGRGKRRSMTGRSSSTPRPSTPQSSQTVTFSKKPSKRVSSPRHFRK